MLPNQTEQSPDKINLDCLTSNFCGSQSSRKKITITPLDTSYVVNPSNDSNIYLLDQGSNQSFHDDLGNKIKSDAETPNNLSLSRKISVDNRRSSIRSPQKSPSKIDIFASKKEEKPFIRKRFWFFEKIHIIYEKKEYKALIILFTVYALLVDDIKQIVGLKNTDPIFDTFTILALINFIIEIVLSIYTKKGYLLSYYFFLDLLSTLTLVLELSFINELIFSPEK